jgi:hypothetical protein
MNAFSHSKVLGNRTYALPEFGQPLDIARTSD